MKVRGSSIVAMFMSTVLALGMAPAAAFAEMQVGSLDASQSPEYELSTQAGMTWDAPSSPVSVADNVITVGSHSSGTAAPELLGLNGTVISTKQITATTLAQARATNRFGVFGSSANENPNPYLANSFYNHLAAEEGKALSPDPAARETRGASNASQFNVYAESDYDASADLALRPTIILGITGAVGNVGYSLNQSTTTAINHKTWGTGYALPTQSYAYVARIRSFTSSSSLAGKTNSDGNTYELTSSYVKGDEAYDPIGVTYDRGTATSGMDYLVEDVNNLALAAERALGQADGATTRYGDPLEIAADYELYVKGMKWAVLSKIESGQLKKKKVAVISRVTNDNQFKIVKLNADGDDQPIQTLRMAEAAQDTVDDLAADLFPNIDTAGEMRASVAASQIMDADAIICMPPLTDSYKSSADDVKAALKEAGYSESSNGYPMIIDNVMPLGTASSMTELSTSVEAAQLVGVLQGVLYSDVVDPVDATVYYAKKFFHLKDEYIAPFVSSQLEGVTLPASASLPSNGYDVSEAVNRIQLLIEQGAQYYYERDSSGTYTHKATIDEARPRIMSTDLLDDRYGCGVTNVTVKAPSGAAFTIVDEHDRVVPRNSDGTYTIDDDSESILTVTLSGYRAYKRSVKGSDGAQITVSTADMVATRTLSFALPKNASVKWVHDASKRVVQANEDGSYTLDAGQTATYSVSMVGYEDYEGKIAAGNKDVTVELAKGDFALEAVPTTIIIPLGSSLVVTDAKGKVVKPVSENTYRLTREAAYKLTVTHPRYEKYVRNVKGGEEKIIIRFSDMTERTGKTSLVLDKAKVTASDIDAIDSETVKTLTLGAKVKTIDKSAFSKCGKLTTLVVKTKKFTKNSVKDSLAGSKVKTVRVSVGNASINKKFVAKYKKIFTKQNCGVAVTVK